MILLNSDAGGNEHPLTTEFIHWYSENVHHVHEVTPLVCDMGTRRPSVQQRIKELALNPDDKLTFDVLANIKGFFPSSRIQFCTEHLKLYPQQRWIRENIIDKGLEFVRYAGVRWDESSKRAKRPHECEDEFFGVTLRHPIIDWTKEMCFAYVAAYNERVNELYTLGFERVGCAPCVNSKKADVRNWARRFPEMIDKVREWEKKTGLPFFKPKVPGKDINWIDEVVEWPMTARGGKETDLEVLEEPPACQSAYGLCG
ncbi:phosphoadenosine phosphosulfate reductase domain-containing protein [Bremerella sp. P1]|uniref:phosphoadenosine phosphosulfate reductase domain-containing protein n=1 Tax=Bremerella sp. P1 TaxID=3026424 RepID=UPI003083D3DB